MSRDKKTFQDALWVFDEAIYGIGSQSHADTQGRLNWSLKAMTMAMQVE